MADRTDDEVAVAARWLLLDLLDKDTDAVAARIAEELDREPLEAARFINHLAVVALAYGGLWELETTGATLRQVLARGVGYTAPETVQLDDLTNTLQRRVAHRVARSAERRQRRRDHQTRSTR